MSPSPRIKTVSRSSCILGVRRFTITSSRMQEYSRDRVMITVNDHEWRKKNQTMTRCVYGWATDIDPQRFQIVRRSGLFANTQRKKLGQAGESLSEISRNISQRKLTPSASWKKSRKHRERQRKDGVDRWCVSAREKTK